MAINGCTQFTSDWGSGRDGYVVPAAEDKHKPFAYYAIVGHRKFLLKRWCLPL